MWINPETQHTYANHSEIRAAFPQVSLPAELSDELIASMGQLFVGMSSLIREQELLVSGA